jgi:hypothetical protein|tara:strand:+ start:416 stop:631 length:216 start_codon:yes stop_codon:yes gene_type:complete
MSKIDTDSLTNHYSAFTKAIELFITTTDPNKAEYCMKSAQLISKELSEFEIKRGIKEVGNKLELQIQDGLF